MATKIQIIHSLFAKGEEPVVDRIVARRQSANPPGWTFSFFITDDLKWSISDTDER